MVRKELVGEEGEHGRFPLLVGGWWEDRRREDGGRVDGGWIVGYKGDNRAVDVAVFFCQL